MKLRLGTRASALAVWQADWVAARLAEQGVQVEIVPVSTSGDRHQTGPIEGIGTSGVFTKEIQRALLEGIIDVAVHSLKDLATAPVAGLVLAAVPERGPTSDALVFADSGTATLADMPARAVVGTGSPRRKAQLLRARADLRVADIRGNVETRLAKLDAGDYDAIVLAEAGLRRLGFESRLGQILPSEIMMPAVGQGALGIETREDDQAARTAVALLDHLPTRAAVAAERAMLAALDGGCLAPVAAWGRVEEDVLRLSGRVTRVDGSRQLDAALDGRPDEAETLGRLVARQLTDQGAAELIDEARRR